LVEGNLYTLIRGSVRGGTFIYHIKGRFRGRVPTLVHGGSEKEGPLL